jgi:hypothetical protein
VSTAVWYGHTQLEAIISKMSVRNYKLLKHTANIRINKFGFATALGTRADAETYGT